MHRKGTCHDLLPLRIISVDCSETYGGIIANSMSMLKMRKDALVSLHDGLWIYAPSIDVFWAKHA